MKIRIKKLPQQHELNAHKWKHDYGGPLVDRAMNYFDDGGFKEEVKETTLPELIIKPSTNDRKSLARLKRMLPDKESRLDMYWEIDPYLDDENEPIKIAQNESINRLYEVYKQSKYPKVSNHRTILPYLTYPFKRDLDRASYNPLTNTISIPNSEGAKYNAEEFIPELAHAYQYYSDDINLRFKDIFHLPGDIKIKGKSGYERPGHMEHTAHSIIEPAIYDYIQGYTDFFSPLKSNNKTNSK